MQAPSHFPLLRHADRNSTLAWHEQHAVTANEFLAQALALAQRLPHGTHALNLCESPYAFLLSFAAVLIRGQTNLLPPNRLPATLHSIAASYANTYLISECDVETLQLTDALPHFQLPTDLSTPHASDSTAMPQIPAEHIAAVLFTSGSTGHSQAYIKPWRTLVLGAQANARASLDSSNLRPTLVGTVPSQHAYGLETLVMLPLQGYCAVYGQRPFFPHDIAQALQDLPAPRILVTTPIHLRALVAAETTLPALQSIWSATAPLGTTLATECEAMFKTHIHEIFGCTELGTCATRRSTRDPAWRLMDEFNIDRDRDGNAFVNAAHLPSGAALQDRIEWVDARHFKLLGRGVDMINIAGKRASLADLNAKLLAIPGVVDGIIFLPENTEDALVRTAALVVAPTLKREHLLDALRSQIDAAFVPRPLLLVDALPRNEVTKLPRAAVMALFNQLQHAQS